MKKHLKGTRPFPPIYPFTYSFLLDTPAHTFYHSHKYQNFHIYLSKFSYQKYRDTNKSLPYFLTKHIYIQIDKIERKQVLFVIRRNELKINKCASFLFDIHKKFVFSINFFTHKGSSLPTGDNEQND